MLIEALRRLRDARTLKRRAIPEPLWRLTLARFPFLGRRSHDELVRLEQLATLFLSEKEFTGSQNFEVTDEVAVAIAAQACLPVLRLGLSWYDRFVGIVVHPDEVRVRREVMDDDGVVHQYHETLVGEAMEGGPVMLSWRDVEAGGETADWGYNVVIHEFAHVLDMRDGAADGVPPLADRAAREAWRATLLAEFEGFCAQIEHDEETVLDPYGAEAPDEFFAVASEAFFVAPRAMRAERPDLYRLLASFYKLDPAEQ